MSLHRTILLFALLLIPLTLLGCDPIENDELPTDPVLLDADGDGVTVEEGDCDDSESAIYPGAAEACSGSDTDCDGLIDEGFDLDGDGASSCVTSSSPFDCDDGDPSRAQGLSELCDAKDNDCDLRVDEDPAFDEDGDSYLSCRSADAEGNPIPLDCDDGDSGVNPGAPERCNGKDDDCDSLVDSQDDNVVGAQTYYTDGDGDGAGDPDAPKAACELGVGLSEEPTDCKDNDPDIGPHALELCDGVNQDCDDSVDEGLDVDGDFDGFVDCQGGLSLDCDDFDADTYPGAEERCDGIDQDCDADIDEDFDVDRDGVSTCGDAPDCDDGDPSSFPGAVESCNGVDNDCGGGSGDYLVDRDGGGDFLTLQAALDAAGRDCVVTVAPGTYTETITFGSTALTLVSEEGPETTIINVGPLAPAPAVIFPSSSGSRTVLEGFTIRADKGDTGQYSDLIVGGAIQLGLGSAPVIRGNIIESSTADQGGAIACMGCLGALLEGNTFEGNQAFGYVSLFGSATFGEGGAIYVEEGELVLIDNTFKDNNAESEGGAIMVNQGVVEMDGDVFMGNEAPWGGAVYGSEADLTVVSGTFEGNRATGLVSSSDRDTAEGGAIYADDGSEVTIDNGIFVDNLAQGGVAVGYGGGILIFEGRLEMQRSFLHGSASPSFGGGIYCGKSELLFVNNIVSGSRSEIGGGAYVDRCQVEGFINNTLFGNDTRGTDPLSGSLEVANSAGPIINNDISGDRSGYGFIYDSEPPGEGEPIDFRVESFTYNNVFDNALGPYGLSPGDQTGNQGNLSVNALYVDPEGGDFHLGEGSPLIDAGRPDIEDPDLSRSDIGAYGGPGGDWTLGGAP